MTYRKRLNGVRISGVKYVKRITQWLILKPERFFLLFAVVFGLFLVFALPPYRGLDEASHIFRITQLSEADLFIEKVSGGYGHPIPAYINQVNVYEFSQSQRKGLIESFKNRYDNGNYTEHSSVSQDQIFEGSGSYSPLVYAHYLPVGMIEKVTHFNSYIYTLLLRLSNLALFIVCLYFAIRLIPSGKWLLTVVGLLPMTLHQAATVSADVILISALAIFIALICHIIKNGITKKTRIELGVIFSTGLLIGGSKPGYLLLVVVALLIPTVAFGSLKKKLLYIGGLFVCCLILLGTWSFLLQKANLGQAVETFRARVNGGQMVSTKQVIEDTAIKPWKGINLFRNTFLFEINSPSLPIPRPINYNAVPDFILSNFTGMFGSINIPLPDWAAFVVILNILIAYLGITESFKISRNAKLFIGGVIAIQFLGIFFVFWKSWTSSTMIHVWGLQGRYYIPLLPLLIFLRPKKSIFSWKDNTTKILLVFGSLLPLLVMSLLIIETFYSGL